MTVRVFLSAEPVPSVVQPSLFDPVELWMRPARAFATDRGEEVEHWAIDRRVKIGGVWYSVEWDEISKEWEINPA